MHNIPWKYARNDSNLVWKVGHMFNFFLHFPIEKQLKIRYVGDKVLFSKQRE